MSITSEDLKNYWLSFFPKEFTVDKMEETIKKTSGVSTGMLLQTYDAQDDSLVESMGWREIKYQKTLDAILDVLQKESCWVYFYEPVLKKYIDYLFETVENSSVIADKRLFLTGAVDNICNVLHLVAFQTIIAEIYYAKQGGLLQGEDREQRGRYFSRILLKNDDYRRDVYRNYPELLRLMDVKVKNGVEFIVKVMSDTAAALSEIEVKLNNRHALGKIKEIAMGEGDTHNNGKSVTKLTFSSGKVILYKPHSLGMEEKFYEFVCWLNEFAIKRQEYQLVAARSLAFADAGWMEYIEHQDCKSEEQLKYFYYKTGILLCVLYTTNGMDIHHENLIAHGDTPVLVDLETFIHPDLSGEPEDKSAMASAAKELSRSVLLNALLPTHLVSKNSDKVFDLGGLSGAKAQQAPRPSKFIENYGTDEAKIKIMHATIEAKDNNPRLHGEFADSKCYTESVINGFKDMYQWVLNNKSLYTGKICDLFSGDIARVVCRPTNVYAQVLHSSYHPDILTNPVDRVVFLHRLASIADQHGAKANQAEIDDLVQGDIPYFRVLVGETAVQRAQRKVIDLKSSALDVVKLKIQKMGEIDLCRQIAIISSKLSDKPIKEETTTVFPDTPVQKWENKKYIIAAETIADFVIERSVSGVSAGGHSRTWFGCLENEIGLNDFRPLDCDLYYGLAGLALFFNFLEKVSLRSNFRGVTDEICTSLVEFFFDTISRTERSEDSYGVGAFSGITGAAYVLFNIDHSNNSNKYEETLFKIIELIDARIDQLSKFDVIGDVGIIGAMLSIYEKTTSAQLKNKSLELCIKVRRKLKKATLSLADLPGITWTKKGYVGYAHGNAGIVAQLYRLNQFVHDDEIPSLINEALRFERASYVENEKNWKRAVDESHFSCGWCHGAPGILLSKLQLKKLGFEDTAIEEEIRRSIETTIAKGLSKDWCLCHGDMGNLVILKEAGIVLDDKKLYQQSVGAIEELTDFLLKMITTEKFKQNENNGFMLGLAGAGYEILRTGYENALPNVLALE